MDPRLLRLYESELTFVRDVGQEYAREFPKIAARLADLGATAFTGSPAELDKIVVEQTEKWGKLIRAASIKAE